MNGVNLIMVSVSHDEENKVDLPDIAMKFSFISDDIYKQRQQGHTTVIQHAFLQYERGGTGTANLWCKLYQGKSDCRTKR